MKPNIAYCLLICLSLLVLFSCGKKKENEVTPPEKTKEMNLEEDEETTKYLNGTESANFFNLLNKPLTTPTFDGSGQITHPSVLYFPNKWKGYKFWMANTPYPRSNDFFENPCILVSNNGIKWEESKLFKNPLDEVSLEDNKNKYHFSDAALVYNNKNNELECWYRYSKNGVIDQIYRRRSKDGIIWTKRELLLDHQNCKPKDMLMSPSIIWKDNKYLMWTVAASPFRVEYRESQDGFNWSNPITTELNLPKNIQPWHVEVKLIDNNFEMLLNCMDNQVKESNYRFLMCSKSVNGLLWDNFEPSIQRSSDRSKWNGKMIYRSSFIKIKENYIVYYAGMAENYFWRIGVAVGKSLNNLKYI